MSSSNYIKRISFLDGQILQDFHLNTMQRNIAEAFKSMTVMERYDMLMLVSPYNYYFSEAFINNTYRDDDSTSNIDTLRFVIEEGSWETKVLELPEQTDEFYLLSRYDDDKEQQNFVKFYYRTNKGNDWIEIVIDEPVYIPTTKYFQLKVDCRYEGAIKPSVYDFALLFK